MKHGIALPNLHQHLSVIVRTVGERTTEACLHLLRQAVPKAKVILVNEHPFSLAMRRGFEMALELERKWTLVLDADVLALATFPLEITTFADSQQANVFVVQGLVHDKLFNIFRPAGNHLYRTRYLKQALALIPEEGTTLRPETETITRMRQCGYLYVQKEFIAGLHDHEQAMIDLAKKGYLHAAKHSRYLKLAWPFWNRKAQEDADFVALLEGVAAGKQHEGPLFVDSVLLHNRVLEAVASDKLAQKQALPANAYDSSGLGNIILSCMQEPEMAHIQQVMCPADSWNRVHGWEKSGDWSSRKGF